MSNWKLTVHRPLRNSCLSEELRDDERVVKAAVARFLGG